MLKQPYNKITESVNLPIQLVKLVSFVSHLCPAKNNHQICELIIMFCGHLLFYVYEYDNGC